jgi:transcriptional antiterminator RfaH
MQWHMVHTKPKQEERALQNLKQLGYQCYLPTLPTEKLRQARLSVTHEPLFPRYLFVRMGEGNFDKSWTPIRSTNGVSRLVNFGTEPAKIENSLVAYFQAHEAYIQGPPRCLVEPEEWFRSNENPLADIENIYKIVDGQRRVMALMELLSRFLTASTAHNGTIKKLDRRVKFQ